MFLVLSQMKCTHTHTHTHTHAHTHYGGSSGKEPALRAKGSIPVWGVSPGGGHDKPL